MGLKIPLGIDAIPTNTIPDDPKEFVSWFKSVGIKRWFANADVRNAIAGPGITITGEISSPATIAAASEIQGLTEQPYVLVGPPVGPTVLTDYRSITAESGVLSLTDGGPEGTLTVGVLPEGIGVTQIDGVMDYFLGS